MHLTIGTTLQGGKYTIGEVLGQGGFGITYLATQNILNRPVAIKEFFFKDICDRDEYSNALVTGKSVEKVALVERYLNKFIKEARTISALEHPCIISIHDVFRENNTAYYVMDYVDGISLEDYVKEYGAVSEEKAVEWIRSVCEAISYIHDLHINHLDIKPSNIMLRNKDQRIVLIDFGLSKHYESDGSQTTTTPVGLSLGYAPFEQYQSGGVASFTPQTDVYSIGATLFKLVTGNRPPEPSEIMQTGLPVFPVHLSQKTRRAITESMKLRKLERPACISDFVSLLPQYEITSIISQPEAPIEEQKSDWWKNKKGLLVGLVVIFLVAIVWGVMNMGNGSEKKTPSVNESTKTEQKVKGQKTGTKVSTPVGKEKVHEKTMEEPVKQEPAKKIDPSEEAISKGDYNSLRKLADQGNIKACEAMAEYYMKQNDYDLADKYATKAYNMGSKRARKTIEGLQSLGYYDDKQ